MRALTALAVLICLAIPCISVGSYDPGCLKKTTLRVADRDVVITLQDAERIRRTVEKYLAEKKPRLDPSVTGPGPAFIDCEGTVRMGAWILEPAWSAKPELRLAYRIVTNDLLMVRQIIDLKQVAGEWTVAGVDVETLHRR